MAEDRVELGADCLGLRRVDLEAGEVGDALDVGERERAMATIRDAVRARHGPGGGRESAAGLALGFGRRAAGTARRRGPIGAQISAGTKPDRVS